MKKEEVADACRTIIQNAEIILSDIRDEDDNNFDYAIEIKNLGKKLESHYEEEYSNREPDQSSSRIEESPSYRDSMNDSGRGHLLP